MPIYVYEALDKEGKYMKESGVFDSPQALYHKLRQKGLLLISCRRRWFSFNNIMFTRMKRLAVAEFLRNLSLVIKGGVPLLTALEDFMSHPLDAVLKRKLTIILNKISEGFLFSEALMHAGGFSPVIVVMAQIGEESGNLDRTLLDAAVHLESIQDIISRTRSALMYPLFILIVMGCTLAFWLLYVFPQMLELFKGMGIVDLPLTTMLLIEIVEWIKRWWPLLPLVLFVVGLVRLIANHYDQIKYYWDLLIMKIPIIGNIIRASQLAFFFEYLSLLTGSGIDIVKSMKIMTDSMKNEVMRQTLESIRTDVMAGHSLTESFSHTRFFDQLILRLVGVGEQTGNMPEQLKTLAAFYMKRVKTLVDAISKSIEPVLIVLAGTIFVIIAMGLLGPIYDLMTRIQ